jgi:hypothetical protein
MLLADHSVVAVSLFVADHPRAIASTAERCQPKVKGVIRVVLGPAGLVGVEGFEDGQVPAAEVGGEPVLDKPVDEGVEGEGIEALVGHAPVSAVLHRESILLFGYGGAGRRLLDVQIWF